MITDKTVLQKLIEENWSDYCDLDSWVNEMTMGSSTSHISKHVIKMAMKHLAANLHKTHAFLCGMEEATRARMEDTRDN